MYNHLSSIVANYTTTTLSVTPQSVMTETGQKSQKIYQSDGGDISVITMSTSNWFLVNLQWDIISPTDAATIFDFWNNSAKGNGMARTFYWLHPLDGYTYTVRFFSELQRKYGHHAYRGIDNITLRVEGKKP